MARYFKMIIVPQCVVAGLMLLPVVSVRGQSDSLSYWLRTALDNNPMITAATANTEAKKKEIRIAPALPDPTISGGYFITPVETRVGPQQAKIGASQMIPWPGKLFTRKTVAEKEYEAAQEALKSVKAKVLAEVRETYAEYYAIGKEIEITKDNLKLLQEMENVLLAQYSAAAISQVSLLKIQVEMAALEDRIRSLDAEEIKILQKAEVLLNLPKNERLSVPSVLPQLKVPEKADSMINLALELNPVLARSHKEVESSIAQVNLAKQTFAPDFMIMTDYIFTGKSSSTMAAGSESGKDPWIIGGSISLPIWTNNKYARIEKASAMKKMQEAMVINIENTTESNSTSLVEEYNDAQRKIKLYTSTLIPLAQQTIALIEEAYTNGKATVLDFLDAQRMLLKLQIMLEKQRARRETIAGKIDMLLGGMLTYSSIGVHK